MQIHIAPTLEYARRCPIRHLGNYLLDACEWYGTLDRIERMKMGDAPSFWALGNLKRKSLLSFFEKLGRPRNFTKTQLEISCTFALRLDPFG
jgi:hypothetical protein